MARQQRGFTRLELMIVIPVIAILFVLFAAPRKGRRVYYQGKDTFAWLGELTNEDAEKRQQAVAAVCHILDNENFMRGQLVRGLGECGPEAKAAIPTLKRLLEDDDNYGIRRIILEAIKSIDPDEYGKIPKDHLPPD